ncbi:MAG: PASTA domain-containing protein [Muribaculaceae bacterium]|nr:PASTA domain-containing protein [Muribaculaceae bacterium]
MAKSNAFVQFWKKHPIICNLILIIFVATPLVIMLLIGFLDVWTNHGSQISVPDVKGMYCADAVQTLEKDGFKVEVSDSVYDEAVKPGTVIETWPRANAVVKPGREVYLTITAFDTKRVVISTPITGVSKRQAISYIEKLGIKNIRISTIQSPHADLVLSAKCNGREISVGEQLPITATITLEVGSGYAVEESDSTDIDMPDITIDDVTEPSEPSYYD